MSTQTELFTPTLPEGFLYQPEFITIAKERDLVAIMQTLEFQPFNFQGFIATRRVIEHGYEYDFSARKATTAPPFPQFLFPLREKAARLAGVQTEEIVESVVHEYPPGAPIGWHRDGPQFEIIVGVSLLSTCRMRLKPYRTEGKIVSIILEPRSAYIMRGPARWQYQHSIPEVKKLRYSITFRTLRKKSREKAA